MGKANCRLYQSEQSVGRAWHRRENVVRHAQSRYYSDTLLESNPSNPSLCAWPSEISSIGLFESRVPFPRRPPYLNLLRRRGEDTGLFPHCGSPSERSPPARGERKTAPPPLPSGDPLISVLSMGFAMTALGAGLSAACRIQVTGI